MANEEVMAMLWLRDFLAADSVLSSSVTGVFMRSTPTTARTPVVKIDRQSASDLMVVGMYRVWNDLTFLVRGITNGPAWDDVLAIANQIDTVLHRAAGQNSTVAVQEVFREESFSDETIEGGDLYLHAGGFYRLRARAL